MSERDDAEPEEHLDGLHIRQATVLRRSLYRGRAYALVGALACAAAAAQCAWLAYRYVRALGWDARPVALVVLMWGAIAGAAWCARRAAALVREARAMGMPDSGMPPDFSTLSDGSQRARNLEDVH